MSSDNIKLSDLRKMTLSGGCILWRGNGLLSRLIEAWSEFSHASLIVQFDRYYILGQEAFLVEALESGLELTNLFTRIKEYDGDAFLFFPDGLNKFNQETIVKQALCELAKGKKYDLPSLIANMFGRVHRDSSSFFLLRVCRLHLAM